EITTACGRSVRVTSSHSVFVWENGERRLKRGDEIKPGDLVLAPARLAFGPAAAADEGAPAAEAASARLGALAAPAGVTSVRLTRAPVGRAAILRLRRPAAVALAARARGEANGQAQAGLRLAAEGPWGQEEAVWPSPGGVPDRVFNLHPAVQRVFLERFRPRRRRQRDGR